MAVRTLEHAHSPRCRLWISATDHGALNGSRGNPGFGGKRRAVFCLHGLTDRSKTSKGAVGTTRAGYVPKKLCALVRPGKTVPIGTDHERRNWQCISGYSHTPDILLYCADLNVLIAATWCCHEFPAISVYDIEPEADALCFFSLD
jgi:hypothetical protein